MKGCLFEFSLQNNNKYLRHHEFQKHKSLKKLVWIFFIQFGKNHDTMHVMTQRVHVCHKNYSKIHYLIFNAKNSVSYCLLCTSSCWVVRNMFQNEQLFTGLHNATQLKTPSHSCAHTLISTCGLDFFYSKDFCL